MKTRNTKLGVIAITLLSAAMPFTAKAQDKVKASVGADIVSGYIWRGQDVGGVSLQPNASIAYKGLSLEAWGSVGIEKTDADGYDAKEFDLTLGYSTGGFSVSITDYWYNTGAGYFHYGAHNTTHLYEAQVGYDFGPVAVNWYTNFAGDDGVKKVKVLSGGEKVRCLLSKMMISGANVLVLDEPTDHLDMESITALNNGLIKFPGVLLFASRDHQVVQTTANRIMEIVNGQLIDKITTYDEYLESDEMARKRFTYTITESEENDD